MPSAARQRLPIDLWRQGHRKHFSGSPGPFTHTQEIHTVQASPGHCEVFHEDKQQYSPIGKGLLNKSPRKQTNTSGSPKLRRGSVNTLSVGLSDLENSTVNGRMETVELSSSAKSDSYLSYNSSIVCDAYAMESSVAPHPSDVPLPPLEWLQSSSKHTLSFVVSDISLRAILGCHMVV